MYSFRAQLWVPQLPSPLDCSPVTPTSPLPFQRGNDSSLSWACPLSPLLFSPKPSQKFLHGLFTGLPRSLGASPAAPAFRHTTHSLAPFLLERRCPLVSLPTSRSPAALVTALLPMRKFPQRSLLLLLLLLALSAFPLRPHRPAVLTWYFIGFCPGFCCHGTCRELRPQQGFYRHLMGLLIGTAPPLCGSRFDCTTVCTSKLSLQCLPAQPTPRLSAPPALSPGSSSLRTTVLGLQYTFFPLPLRARQR